MDGRGDRLTVEPVPPEPAEPKAGPLTGILGRLSRFFSATKTISYDEARVLARHENPEVRRGVATSPVALGEIDLLLAHDADQGVRLGLAQKIARLAPELNAKQRDRIRQSTYEALEVLVRDQVIRVRQVLSEALKDVAKAPPEVINRLARDAELVVAAPVLQFSPVLTDEDLLEIIAAGPVPGALGAISRRHQVVEMVSEAIIEADDVEATAGLLANPSAQIREETLDRVVARAPTVEAWHGPLVRRPSLPSRVAPRLAMFVADSLLDVLTRRRDLDEGAAEEVRAVVARRLGAGPGERMGRKSGRRSGGDRRRPANHDEPGREAEASPELPLEKIGRAIESPRELVQRLHEAQKLSEQTVADALDADDRDFVVAALVLLARLSRDVIKKVVSTQNARGMVAVTRKAGLSAGLAAELQRKLLGLTPPEVLRPKSDGAFPLSDEEVAWQLDFLREL